MVCFRNNNNETDFNNYACFPMVVVPQKIMLPRPKSIIKKG